MTDREVQRRPDGTFAPGQSGYERHGGEAAVKALQRGTPLTGLAVEAERAVRAELEEHGRHELVLRNATRLQAAADLYWTAVAKAAEDRDLEALDRYVKRYGWLASCALRAWAQVRQERPDGANVLDYEALLAAQRQREAGDE